MIDEIWADKSLVDKGLVDQTEIVQRETLSRGFGHVQRIVFRRRRSDGRLDDLQRDIMDVGDGVTTCPMIRSAARSS